ncbi:hypothetical protein RI367_006272 [Sorochytrium milnesiophthora]
MPASSIDTPRRHVVIVSGCEWGHLVPTAELGKQLVRLEQCDVSFVVSESAMPTIARRGLIPSEFTPYLKVVGIRDGVEPADEGLLPRDQKVARKAKMNAHWDALARVIRTCQGAEGPQATDSDFETIPLPKRRIDHVVVGMFVTPAAEPMRDTGVPISALWTASANATLQAFHGLQLARELEASGAPAAPFEPGMILRDNQPLPAIMAKIFGPIIDSAMACRHVLVNTFEDLEAEPLKKLRALPGMQKSTVCTVGPLSLFGRNMGAGDSRPTESATERFTSDWLDTQRAKGRAVVYVSHGSNAELSEAQVLQLAKALASLSDRYSFLWSLRKSSQQTLPSDLASAFLFFNHADGHQDHPPVQQYSSVLVMDWAPQLPILSHSATKAFVTHCGWNSTVEALSKGVPMIAWPLGIDQFTNTSTISSENVAVAVTIAGVDLGPQHVIPCDDIVQAVNTVLGSNTYSENAQRLGGLARAAVMPETGGSARNLAAFLTQG